MTFPPEANLTIYRDRYPDLASLSDDDLAAHWEIYGRKEGRIASAISSRHDFMGLLTSRNSVLEIGVFDSPSIEFLRTSNRIIHYADWLNREMLVERAKSISGRNPSTVPEIRYALCEGYEQIETRYEAVVSHHCIEHQPDLIRHFQKVFSILGTGGWYLFSVPDKRRCFDHYLPETSITEVVSAYYSRREKPSLQDVIEHRCFTRINFEDVPDPYECSDYALRQCMDAAFAEYSDSDYVDVHCWRFTPDGLKELYHKLVAFELLPKPSEFRVYCAGYEFYVAISL